MNTLTNSKIAIVHDSSLISDSKFLNNDVGSVLKNLNKRNKGVNYNEEKKKLIIDNKYYQCELNLDVIFFDGCNLQIEDKYFSNVKINNFEGLIIYWNANNLKRERLSRLLDYFSASKPLCSIILFEEDRSFLTSLCEFQNFIEFSIDNNLEIITNIKDFDNLDEDDGVGALGMSLQSCLWSNAKRKIENKLSDKPQKDIKRL